MSLVAVDTVPPRPGTGMPAAPPLVAVHRSRHLEPARGFPRTVLQCDSPRIFGGYPEAYRPPAAGGPGPCPGHFVNWFTNAGRPFVHGTKGQAFDVDGQSLPGRFVDHASPKLAEHVCAHVIKPRVYGMNRSKRLAAEFVGTFWLAPAGCGSAAVLAAYPCPGIRLCRNLARETLIP